MPRGNRFRAVLVSTGSLRHYVKVWGDGVPCSATLCNRDWLCDDEEPSLADGLCKCCGARLSAEGDGGA